MLDIHAHLYWKSYDADRDEVVKRAREAGVKKMICVGTSPEDNPLAIKIAEKYEDVYAGVGLHPSFFDEYLKVNKKSVIPTEVEESKDPCAIAKAKATRGRAMLGMTEWEKEQVNELRILAGHPKVIAIGECGLDYFVREKPVTEEIKARQKEGFLAQIKLAEELKLPMIIHTRPSLGSVNAHEDLLDILKNPSRQRRAGIPYLSSPLIFHCYQGDTKITKKFLELPNVYFSFAGNITYPVKKTALGTKDDLRETLKLVPLNRLFVETDSPFLAPEGKRGERNEPAYVQITAKKLCDLKGISMADLEMALEGNFQQAFKVD
jgi:TatD DNase family protein